MRIWEQGLVATYALPGYRELILEHYAAYQRPGTEIAVHGTRDDASSAAAQIAGRAVNYGYLHRFHDNQILDNVRRAAAEGYDAVILGVLQDPVLREARSIVPIPVLGYGETSMLTACMLGARFTFVCINAPMDPLVRRMIRDTGLESRAAPTAYMDCGYDDFRDAVAGRPQRVIDAFQAAGRKAIKDHGVDVLLPGQTIIAELLWKSGVTELDGAVVLDPRLPLLRTAEMLVDLRRAGIGISQRGYDWAQPPADLTAAVRRFYDLD